MHGKEGRGKEEWRRKLNQHLSNYEKRERGNERGKQSGKVKKKEGGRRRRETKPASHKLRTTPNYSVPIDFTHFITPWVASPQIHN